MRKFGMTFGGLAVVATLAAGSPATAQSAPADRLFKQRCSICHSVVAGKASTVGPNLKGVVGRKAGTTGFAYSPAMKQAKLVWTPANLDRYLTAPGKMLPGTRMVIAIPDAAQRSEIIRYLSTVK